jgi:hypothetical protein
MSGGMQDAANYYQGAQSSGGQAPTIPQEPFPAEYKSADTSPKEVEITSSSSNVDISI